MRIWYNGLTRLPWDSPLYEHELIAIRRWERRYGVTFRPGMGMAVYDPGHDGVVPP